MILAGASVFVMIHLLRAAAHGGDGRRHQADRMGLHSAGSPAALLPRLARLRAAADDARLARS
ncbi:MAG TPA: hypothetical protein PLB41_16785 [Rubrivivax sp.]|nr:hypothetical protein [Rubrivivax sp.]HPO20052.1 hypothetical protein [Rubrivivax sp.]